jgi:fimbrial chaperone protein
MVEGLLSRRTVVIGAGLALSGLALRQAGAAALQFNPVSIAMDPGQDASALQVTNSGESPATIQVRGFRWQQQGNEDKLDPTTDLVVSPPQFTIPAGQTQTVRVLSRDHNQQTERTFRLLLDEIPNPRANTVSFAMRVSLPVVQAAMVKGAPVLSWSTQLQSDGQTVLVVRNSGDRMVRFIKVEPMAGKKTLVAQIQSPSPYALPGGERRWIVRDGDRPWAASGDALHIGVDTQQLPRIEASVPISR